MISPFANDRAPDDSSGVHVQRLLQGASDATLLGHKLRMLDIEAAHRLALHHSHFNPDQPRVPAGHPDGGQWTIDGFSEAPPPVRLAALDPTHLLPGLIKSDTAPGGIRVWTKYAEAKSGDEDQSKTDVDPEAAADAKLVEQTTEILHNVVLDVSRVVIRLPGTSPQQFGTAVHVAFANRVRLLNLPGIGREGVEQSFDKGGEARYGQDGSIRTDVVLRNARGTIIAIYDLKTGKAIIAPSTSRENRSRPGCAGHRIARRGRA